MNKFNMLNKISGVNKGNKKKENEASETRPADQKQAKQDQQIKNSKKKGGTMIKKCREEDRKMLKDYLNQKPVYHTFLLSDLDRYGFDKDYQTIYMQEENGDCVGVFLKYFNNFILAGDEEKLDYEKIAGLATEEITTVMGKADIVRNTVKYVGRQVHMTYNNLYIHRGSEEQALKEHKVRFADSDDVDRIYEFLMSFEEMKNLYSEKKMIENRINSGEGVHAVIEEGGRIAAHGNSAASADLTCMMGGICVKEEYRGKGYAKDIIRSLCREIHSQGKIPCIFAPEEPSYSIFQELGFEIYGRWGAARLI